MNRRRIAMKKTVVLVVTLLAATLALGQAEHLSTATTTSVSLGRGRVMADNLPTRVGSFHITAHHCGAYHVIRHKFLAWGKKVDQARVNECINDPSTTYFEAVHHNLRTNAGADAQASQMANTATQAAACNFFGLAADSSNAGAGTIAATDTTLATSGTGSTEITTNGLARAQATYAHTTGTATFTLTHTFTDTTAQTAGVNKTGVFNAASSGTMCFEATFTAVTLNVNDTLAETYTVNY